MYKIISEWDYGFEDCIFTTEELAETAAREAFNGYKEDDETFEEAMELNLIYFQKLKVIDTVTI